MFINTVPGTVLVPIISNITENTVDLTWYPPINPNGVIIAYNIYVNDVSADMVSISFLKLNICAFFLFSI